MGVTGLWQLLEPTGRPVTMEALQGKTVAVDVSLWLHQAVRGSSEHGRRVRNPHLVTLFNRIAKLLHYKVRPVFVFDGPNIAPLKKATLLARRRRREVAGQKLNKIHRKILLNHVKQHAMKTVTTSDASTVLPQRDLPSTSQTEDDLYVLSSEQKEIIVRSDEEMSDVSEESESATADAHNSSYSELDVESKEFKSLPVHLQHEVLLEMRESPQVKSDVLVNVHIDGGDDFSSFQLDKLLKKNRLSQQLSSVRRQISTNRGGLALESFDSSSLSHSAAELKAEVMALIKNAKQGGEEYAPTVETKLESLKTMGVLLKSGGPQAMLTSGRSHDVKMMSLTENKTPEKPSELEEMDTQNVKQRKMWCDDDQFAYPALPSGRPGVKSPVKTGGDMTETGSASHSQETSEIIVEEMHSGAAGTTDERAGTTDRFPTVRLNDVPLESGDKSDVNDANESDSSIAQPTTSNDCADLMDRDVEQENHIREIEHSMSNHDSRAHAQRNEGGTNTPDAGMVEDTHNSSQIQRDTDYSSEVNVTNESEVAQTTRTIEVSHTNESSEIVAAEALAKEYVDEKLQLVEMATAEQGGVEINAKSVDLPVQNISEDEDDDFVDVEDTETEALDAEDVINGSTQKTVNTEDDVTVDSSKGTMDVKNDVIDEEDNGEASPRVDKMDSDHQEAPHPNPQLPSQEFLNEELDALRSQAKAEESVSVSITDQMYQDCQDLLKCFGIPYVVSKSEAEAQCAFLEINGLVQATLTEDSDVWLFGGRRVYKSVFSQDRHIMEYSIGNIFKTLNLDRLSMCRVAMLVGSDYTEGLPNVGPVHALEVLAEFPQEESDDPLEPLCRFSKWYQELQENPFRTDLSLNPTRCRLKNLKTTFPTGFPSPAVIKAYLEPDVDESTERFSWAAPNIDLLKAMAQSKLSWPPGRVDEILGPILKKMGPVEGSQMQITNFTVPQEIKLSPSKTFDHDTSRRIKVAVNKLKGVDSPVKSEPALIQDSTTREDQAKKRAAATLKAGKKKKNKKEDNDVETSTSDDGTKPNNKNKKNDKSSNNKNETITESLKRSDDADELDERTMLELLNDVDGDTECSQVASTSEKGCFRNAFSCSSSRTSQASRGGRGRTRTRRGKRGNLSRVADQEISIDNQNVMTFGIDCHNSELETGGMQELAPEETDSQPGSQSLNGINFTTETSSCALPASVIPSFSSLTSFNKQLKNLTPEALSGLEKSIGNGAKRRSSRRVSAAAAKRKKKIELCERVMTPGELSDQASD